MQTVVSDKNLKRLVAMRDVCVTRDQSRKAYRAVAEQKQAITIQNWEKIITDNKVSYHKNLSTANLSCTIVSLSHLLLSLKWTFLHNEISTTLDGQVVVINAVLISILRTEL